MHYLLELTSGELHFYCTRTVTTQRARCGPALLSRPALPSHTTVTFAPHRVVVHREDDPPPAVPRGRGEVQLCKHPNRATCRIRLSPRKSPVTARQVSLRTPSPATRAHGDVSVFSEAYFLFSFFLFSLTTACLFRCTTRGDHGLCDHVACPCPGAGARVRRRAAT